MFAIDGLVAPGIANFQLSRHVLMLVFTAVRILQPPEAHWRWTDSNPVHRRLLSACRLLTAYCAALNVRSASIVALSRNSLRWIVSPALCLSSARK